MDRLDEDEGFTLDRPEPAEYTTSGTTLEWGLRALEGEPASKTAQLVGMSERRLRDIQRGQVRLVRRPHRNAIIKLALERIERPKSQ